MQSEQFERIAYFWTRRETLTAPQWAEFYQRLMAALASCRPVEASALPDSLADLRHLYFVERVMTGKSKSAPLHLGALQLYFTRFLLDLIDKQKIATGAHIDDKDKNKPKDPGKDPRPKPDRVDQPLLDAEGQICDAAGLSSHGDQLRDYGVTREQVHQAAQVFIQTLSNEMVLLLRHCGCGGLPLKELAEQIASAHYRSGQLGLVQKQKNDAAGVARQSSLPVHRDTILGRWISTLLRLDHGVQQQDIDAAKIVLDILCVVALTVSPEQNNERPTV